MFDLSSLTASLSQTQQRVLIIESNRGGGNGIAVETNGDGGAKLEGC